MKAESKTGLNKVLCGYSYRRISRKIKVLTGCIHKTTKALIRKSMECPEFSILVRFFFEDQQDQKIEMTIPYLSAMQALMKIAPKFTAKELSLKGCATKL
jgi:hypothetical protein